MPRHVVIVVLLSGACVAKPAPPAASPAGSGRAEATAGPRSEPDAPRAAALGELTTSPCASALVAAWREHAATEPPPTKEWPDYEGDGAYVRCATLAVGERTLSLVAAFAATPEYGVTPMLRLTTFDGTRGLGTVELAQGDGELGGCAQNLGFEIQAERIELGLEAVGGTPVIRVDYATDVCGVASGEYTRQRAWLSLDEGGAPRLALRCSVAEEGYVVSDEMCEEYSCEPYELRTLELEPSEQGVRACVDAKHCREFVWQADRLVDPSSTRACEPT